MTEVTSEAAHAAEKVEAAAAPISKEPTKDQDSKESKNSVPTSSETRQSERHALHKNPTGLESSKGPKAFNNSVLVTKDVAAKDRAGNNVCGKSTLDPIITTATSGVQESNGAETDGALIKLESQGSDLTLIDFPAHLFKRGGTVRIPFSAFPTDVTVKGIQLSMESEPSTKTASLLEYAIKIGFEIEERNKEVDTVATPALEKSTTLASRETFDDSGLFDDTTLHDSMLSSSDAQPIQKDSSKLALDDLTFLVLEDSIETNDTILNNNNNTMATEANSCDKDVKDEINKVDAAEKTDDKETQPKKERVGIISDASTLPESDDPQEIRNQFEFYFSDSNLRYDQFLYGLVTKENNWVDVKSIATFNRMKRFKPEAIIPAMEHSTFMELDEKKEKIRRRKPLVKPAPAERGSDKPIDRTLYFRGFGRENNQSQFAIEGYFKNTGVTLASTRLRRDEDKVFKGSAFIEFKTMDDLNKWLGLKDKPDWYGSVPTELTVEDELKDNRTEFSGSTADKAENDAKEGLKYMTKKAFCEMKNNLIKSGKIKPSDTPRNRTNGASKFDAFAPESKNGRGNSSRGGRSDRPDLRNDKWKRGEEVKHRDNSHRRGSDRGNFRGGRGDRNHNNNNRGRDRDHNSNGRGGGYRADRNDRGGRNGSGNRGGRRDSNDRKDGTKGPELDERGVPKIRCLSRSPPPRTNPRYIDSARRSSSSPKRRREEDDASASKENSPKKTKVESDEKTGKPVPENNNNKKRQREEDGHDGEAATPPSPKKSKAEVEA